MERVSGEVMALSEASRHEMYVKLEEVLGAQVANTVMEHLPPVGWADVATKRDLDGLQVLMKHDLDAQSALFESKLEAGLARVSAEVSDRLRTQTLVVCTTLIAGMGVVAALARG
jgi:S-adenosylhomocysteine hydrolase